VSTLRRNELLAQSETLEKETLPPVKENVPASRAEPDEAKHPQDISQIYNRWW
jgi:hypothetical protein